MTYKYGIVIYWSDEDQVFIAEVPELPGCVTHGETPDAALANANEAIELWIDTAKEFGNPVPQPKGQRPTIDFIKPESRRMHMTTNILGGGRQRLSVQKNNRRHFLYIGGPRPTANPKAH